jgi:Tol biopolymer transport system component
MTIHKNVITIIGAISMATMKSSLILLAILVVSIIGASIFSISILSSISPPAHSTFPGENSKIAFSSDRDGNSLAIYVMNAADGSGQTRLTYNPVDYDKDRDSRWSPDGKKIAFASSFRDVNGHDLKGEIYVMNADGTNTTRLTNNIYFDRSPGWSPDGEKIAFTSDRDGNTEIYVMNAADGSGQTNISNNPAREYHPGWSPDGEKIAFTSDRDGNTEIYVMNAADGSGQTRLTYNPALDEQSSWSPDGEKIAFTSDRDGNTEIYVMNADGTNTTRLTYISAIDDEPRWSPDGKKIAFVSTRDQISTEIYVMNAADGSGQTRLTYNPATDSHPDWAPTSPPLPPSEPIQTFLTLNAIRDVPWGKDVIVRGKLVAYASNNAQRGEGIGGKTITFDGMGAANLPDNVVTNADGTFTAKGASPAAVATGWEVQAHFAGDSSHVASNVITKTYNTVKHNVTLSVSAAKNNVPWSSPTTFRATLTDTSLGGIPISGKRIHFDGTGVIGGVSFDNITDSSGKANATGTSPNTVASGWTYQAHFASDELYVNKDSAIKTYNTTKRATSLSLVVSPSSVAPSSSGDETYKVYGSLKDRAASRAPLSSKTIIFTADSPIAITSNTTTDATGKYIAEGLKVPASPGIYDIQAHFAGDSLYSAKDSPRRSLTVTTAP